MYFITPSTENIDAAAMAIARDRLGSVDDILPSHIVESIKVVSQGIDDYNTLIIEALWSSDDEEWLIFRDSCIMYAKSAISAINLRTALV